MNRRIDDACEVEWKRFEAADYLVVTLNPKALSDVCLGLCMLREQLLPRIELGSDSKTGTLSFERQSGGATTALVRRDRDKVTVLLGASDLAMLLHFFLRTVRDGVAEVDHIDVDAVDRTGATTSVVLKFPLHTAPVSADEMRRRLGI